MLHRAPFVALAVVFVIACASVAPPGGSIVPSTASSNAPSAPNATINPSPAESATTPIATPTPPTSEPTRRPPKTPKPTADTPNIDLYPGGAYILPHSDDPVLGYHVDVTFTVTNTGSDRARRFTVAVTCLGYTLTQDVFGLDGGEGYDISFGFYASIPAEVDYARTVVDSTDRIPETDEDNNRGKLANVPGSCGRP